MLYCRGDPRRCRDPDIRWGRGEDLNALVVAVGEGEYLAHRVARPELGTLLIAWDGSEPVGAAFLGHAFANVFQDPGSAETWIFRRDERITAPYGRITALTADGIRYLRPEAVLLFKAKLAREKDRRDLARAAPRLEDAARTWLRDPLTLAHPGASLAGRARRLSLPRGTVACGFED